MTKRAAATKAQVKRNLQAALSLGLCVHGIAPDGTILIANDNIPANMREEADLDAELAEFEKRHAS